MWSFVLKLWHDLLTWANHCQCSEPLWRQNCPQQILLANWRFDLTYRTLWQPRLNGHQRKGLPSHRTLSSSCCKQARPKWLWPIMVNVDTPISLSGNVLTYFSYFVFSGGQTWEFETCYYWYLVTVPAYCACMNVSNCSYVCLYAKAHAIWTSTTEASAH